MLRGLIGICFCFCVSLSTIASAQNVIEASSNNFQLVGEISPEDAIDMVSELERFRSSLLELHNLSSSTPDVVVPIYIVSDPDIFSILNAPEEFVAVYGATKIGPRVLLNGNELANDPEQLRQSLRHEYVHHFMYMNYPNVAPRWLSEGLAEYYSGYEELSDGSYRIGSTLEQSKIALSYPLHGWYPTVDQLRNFSEIARHYPEKYIPPPTGWSRSPDSTSMFYAQSWALVHYMINQPDGMAKLDRLAERYLALEGGSVEIKQARTYAEYLDQRENEPDEYEQAVIDIIGHSPDNLSVILQHYAAGDMPTQVHKIKEGRVTANIDIKNLSMTDAAARQYSIMSVSASQATINDKMKEIRVIVESDPNQVASLMVSDAAQQSTLGFPVKAMEIIENALKLDPNIRDGQTLKTQIQYEQFANGNFYEYEKMRQTLKPLLAASPNNAQLLVQMVTTGISKPDEPSMDVERALAKITSLNLVRRAPLEVAGLINYYLAKEDYNQALYILRRVKPFVGRNQFQLHSLESELERIISGE